MKCTELLKRDHKVILRALDVLEKMAIDGKKGQTVDPSDVESIVRFLKEFEDEYHQTKEESALFPIVVRHAGSNRPRLEQIAFEHDQERSLLEGLEEALKTRNGADFAYFAGRLVSLLRVHISKEEFGLFGLIEGMLSNEQDDAIVTEFSRFDEGFESGAGTELMKSLHELEWIYLKRHSA